MPWLRDNARHYPLVAITLLVGAVLGLAGGYTPEAFRIAWLVQFPIWAITTLGVLATRRKARRVMAAEGTVVPPLREALRRNRHRRRDVS